MTKPVLNLEKTLADMPNDYVECRELTHSWAAYDVIVHTRRSWEEVVKCERCGTEKFRLVNPQNGAVEQAWRVRAYAPGYLFKGAGPVDEHRGDLVRREALRRKAPKRVTTRATSRAA